MNTSSLLIVGLLVAAFGLAGLAFHARAHTPTNPDGFAAATAAAGREEDRLYACQVFAARAAWGARTRFAGAPRAILNRPVAEIEPKFKGHDKMPTDGIWLDFTRLTPDDLEAATTMVLAGWDWADRWSIPAVPSDAAIFALIFDDCEKRTRP